jgi:SAM-dependent methyltransferase
MDRRLKPLTTVMCEECGLFYSNPMPTADELATYYQKEYRKDYQLARFRPSNKHIRKKQNEAKARYAVIRQVLTGDTLSVLDFGCGSGELVEPGASYASFAQQASHLKIDIRGTDYQSADYAAQSFDAITMLHVLEHIPNPIAALKKAHEWLKDDGILYIEVPNMQGYELKGFEHFHFAHVLGFSRDNLIEELRRAGFRVRSEIDGTSILAEKALGRECTAPIDLKATAAQNLQDYTAPISLYAYVRYHLARLLRRLTRTQAKPAMPTRSPSPAKDTGKLAWPRL